MLYSQVQGVNTKQIILIHGNSQSLHLWDDVVSLLQDQFRLIAVDLPGHGNSFISKQPDKDYSIQGMAIHLKEFILQQSLNEYIIVANSLASSLVGEITSSLINCKGIFLIGANIIGESLGVPDIFTANSNLSVFFSANPIDEDVDKMIKEGSYYASDNSIKKCREIFKKTDPAFRQHIFASLSKQEWTDEIKNLKEINIPIAIIYGEAEKFINVNYLDKSSLKKWRDNIILIKEAGHLVQNDQPKALAALIKEFTKDCFK